VITDKPPALRGSRLRLQAAGFWATDWSLTVLLVLLVGNLFLLPIAEFATWGRVAGRAVLSLVIISGVVATLEDRRILVLTVALAIGSVWLGWANFEENNLYLHLVNDVYSLLFVALLAALILRQVLRPGPITSRRVQGSVAVYLLFGILWAIGYEVVELVEPGCFAFPQKSGATLPQLAYFSFTTLTTLGFGDIVPLRPIARSLVMLEALVGQLFPVILIAGLVTLEIEHRGKTHRS